MFNIEFIPGRYDVISRQTDDATSRFFIVGDWGGLPVSPYDTPSEVAVALAMGKLGRQLNTSFQLALGDNFYYKGVQSVDDARFQVDHLFVFDRSIVERFSRIRSNMFSRQQLFKRHGMF
jgi:hypothetical protein